jgi:hypothetical protein
MKKKICKCGGGHNNGKDLLPSDIVVEKTSENDKTYRAYIGIGGKFYVACGFSKKEALEELRLYLIDEINHAFKNK